MNESESDKHEIVDNPKIKELCKCREYRDYVTTLLLDMLKCNQLTQAEYDRMIAECKASYQKHEQELLLNKQNN
jgi:hypothetical protein